jgi:hypothetical protein
MMSVSEVRTDGGFPPKCNWDLIFNTSSGAVIIRDTVPAKAPARSSSDLLDSDPLVVVLTDLVLGMRLLVGAVLAVVIAVDMYKDNLT